MFRTTFVVLVTAACALARPQQAFLPKFQFPDPQSFGQSNSGITQGQTVGPAGTSLITQQQANTGGGASGGGTNIGKASAGTQSATGLFGTASNSQTNAESVQGSNPLFPGFPVIQGFPSLGGSAKGSAGSQLTQGKTTGPDGSQTVITQLGSSASGSAEGGASSFNKATGSTSSVDTPFGTQTSSNVGSTSVQSSRR